MKWMIRSIFAVLLWASVAVAGDYSVTLLWDYPDPPSDLAGFYLYVDNEEGSVQSANITDETALGWSGTMYLCDGDNNVTCSAYDLVGQESVKSDPLAYNPVPGMPGITTFVVRQ